MSRFVQLICLLIFLVPHHIHSQQEETTEAKAPNSAEPVDAKNDAERKSVEVSKRDGLKMGLGAVLSPDTGPWFFQSGLDYNLEPGSGSIMSEMYIFSHSESVLESTFETFRVGINVMYSTRNRTSADWYLFGGVGWAGTAISADVEIYDTSIYETGESYDVNYVAGVGYDISNRLYIEARWDHLCADLMVLAGFRW